MNQTTENQRKRAALSAGAMYVAIGGLVLLVGPVRTPLVAIAAGVMVVCGLVLLTSSRSSVKADH